MQDHLQNGSSIWNGAIILLLHYVIHTKVVLYDVKVNQGNVQVKGHPTASKDNCRNSMKNRRVLVQIKILN